MRVLAGWWTVERGLYVLLFIAALFLRLLWLGTRPLSPAEAHQAWLAWHNTHPLPHVTVTGVSPLAYALQWLLFLVGGGNDVLARLWSALAGATLVLLPYALREEIGRERALLAGGLLAVSAQAVYWSRNATGVALGMLAALLFLALLATWMHRDQDGAPAPSEGKEIRLPDEDLQTWQRRFLRVGIALGLLMTSTSLAYTALLGMVIGFWPWRNRLARAWHDVGGEGRHRAAAAFLLTVALTGSVFLLDIPALGNVADLAGVWLAGFWRSAGYPWYWVPFRLLADEPLLTALALWGGIRAWQRRETLDSVWLGWAVVGLLLGLRPGRTSADVAFLVIPLAFLAADALHHALRFLRRPSATQREENVLTAAFLVILGFWFMMIAGYLEVGDTRYLPAIIIVPVLAATLVLLYTYWLSREASARVTLVTLLITGVLWTWMAMWVQNLHLARDAALDALPGIERRVTYPDVHLLVNTLERISAETRTDAHEVPLDIMLPGQGADVLRWYTREFKNAREVPDIKSITAPVALTPAGAGKVPGYAGMDWTITITRLPTDLGGRIYHWWFYREAPLSKTRGRIILWYRGEAKGK